jgi:hypothetical protein
MEPMHLAMESTEVQAALQRKDYISWRSAMEALAASKGHRPYILDVVNEANFLKFVAMHEAKMSGDEISAAALREDLGLGQGHRGHGRRK